MNQMVPGYSLKVCLGNSVDIEVEEVPVKWMDRPSATEMKRGRAYEMDRQKSAIKIKCH